MSQVHTFIAQSQNKNKQTKSVSQGVSRSQVNALSLKSRQALTCLMYNIQPLQARGWPETWPAFPAGQVMHGAF